ncbi:uncharacterized protein K460DRAFT_351460 [Cucurbitaria berberidis CBS 394.84]|uniref:Protein kinase domain-containing protein n=1 Tax=Cucurbitaria berberidis CBS 394.84 TaxID=1168544 RepID=A0A9P4GTP4_9PLEO|nr:uncharacterized protein K460DRAFT_351460 [Cucurbitaria berberidis CBS 394.84]KAF1851550.1 hypothetical protein K460DRAFT_351460 [Cucurbitaria berberidis CBS 394.84]
MSMADYEEELIHHPNSRVRTQRFIEQTQTAFNFCTSPAIEPNEDTVQEIAALRRSTDFRCQSAPQLLDFTETTVRPGMHEDCIVGGYLIFVLMTKTSGSRLPYDIFCKLSRAERDEFREAFRKALIEVWSCGIIPNDRALRNIVWDQQERKCYIVDFEDSHLIDVEKEQPPGFTEIEFRRWNIDEERILKYEVCSE